MSVALDLKNDNHEQAEAQAQRATPSICISVETGLYLIVALCAAGLRLWRLDLWPLTPEEILHALAAWNIAQGEPAGIMAYSPLLAAGNLILFGLFHASDAMARLWPALFGTALALTPACFRRQIGREGALVAASLLAFSPSLLSLSRTLDGRAAALLAGLLLVAAFSNLMQRPRWSYLALAGGALAIGLLSAPMFYTLFLILMTGPILVWVVRRPLDVEEKVSTIREAIARVTDCRKEVRSAGLVFIGVLVLTGSGLLMNLDGLGAGAGLLAGWVGGFSFSVRQFHPLTVFWSLPLQEPLALIFGIAGLVMVVRRRSVFGLFMGWWLWFGFAFSIVYAGWRPVDIALLTVPLALLAGSILGELLKTLITDPPIKAEWLLWVAAGIVAVFGYLEFAAFAARGEKVFLLVGVGVPLLLFVTLTVLVISLAGTRRALRSAGIFLAGSLALITLSTAWSSAFQGDPARHPLLPSQRVEPGLGDLVDTMHRYSMHEMQGRYAVPALVVGEELEWLRWALRDFENIRFVSSFGDVDGRRVVITPSGVEPPLGEGFRGQGVSLKSTWWPEGLRGQSLARWLLFQQLPPGSVRRENVILWVWAPVEAG